MLQVRHVDLWLRLAGRTVLPHVADHADDSHWFQGVVSGDNHTAQRIPVAKRSSHQRLVDNHDAGPACHVAVGKVTPFLDRHPEHVECPGAITFIAAGRAEFNGDSFGIRSIQ